MENNILSLPKTNSKKLFHLLIFLVLSSTAGFSQQAIFSTTFLALKDTAYIGDTDTNVRVVVKNISNTSYTGYINFYYSTDTVAFTGVQFYSIPSITLNPLQSDTVKCSIKFDSTYFHPAENIIVIWSSGGAKSAADTLWDRVYIMSSAWVIDLNSNSALAVYPTLTSNFINIEMRTATVNDMLVPEAIRVTDIFGRMVNNNIEVLRNGRNRVRLNASGLKSGIYLLEIYLPQNRRMTAKFIRE